MLSALAGLGVDNALIEMDANEPPIGDGSARPYVELIKKAGVVEQDAPRRFYEVHGTGAPRDEDRLADDDRARRQVPRLLHAGRAGRPLHPIPLDGDHARRFSSSEIAPARTFVFYEDVKPLMDKGLIKGGSLENAVVIRGEQVLGKEPLRFADEFVRHKILDIVGDLALFGRASRATSSR